MKPQLEVKIQGYFDSLENAIELGELERAEIFIGKLSKYFHLFDDELVDYYQYAQDVIDSYWKEEEYEELEFNDLINFNTEY